MRKTDEKLFSVTDLRKLLKYVNDQEFMSIIEERLPDKAETISNIIGATFKFPYPGELWRNNYGKLVLITGTPMHPTYMDIHIGKNSQESYAKTSGFSVRESYSKNWKFLANLVDILPSTLLNNEHNPL